MGTIIFRKIKNRLYTVYTHRYKRWRILIASKIEDKYWTYSKNKLKGSHPDYEAISIKINEVERNIRAASSEYDTRTQT